MTLQTQQIIAAILTIVVAVVLAKDAKNDGKGVKK